MYVTRQYSVPSDMSPAKAAGIITGRAFAATIIPFLLAAIPATIYKAIKKEKQMLVPGYHIILWLLWVLFTIMTTMGSMIGGPDI